ncbi:MAG: von Willebrand factor type A domain protein [Firmicutes bacterium ADurb.Bin506]|nr:MAG: von Willebrand factor type A domain protein [Firmicutes bacterium ADurb.Bin506]
MTDPNKTAVAFVIDESGSMTGRRSDVVGGFKTFIEAQKKLPGECSVSVTTFSDVAKIAYTDRDIKNVGDLEYHPNGFTALYDAVGSTINELGARLTALPEDQRPSRVILVIITDGQENSSTEFDKAKVKEMIDHQREKYNWVVNFLGCGLEAMAEAGKIGIAASNTVQFSSANASAAFANTSQKVGLCRSMDPTVYACAMNYTDGDRKNLMDDPQP